MSSPAALVQVTMSSAKKKTKGRVFPYTEKLTTGFGLQVTGRNNKTGVVESAVCCFCECWGREFTDSIGGDEEGWGGARSQQTTSTGHALSDPTTSESIWKINTQSNSRNMSCCTLPLLVQPRQWLPSLLSQRSMLFMKKEAPLWDKNEL